MEEIVEGDRVCLVHAHEQKGTVEKVENETATVRWDDDDSVEYDIDIEDLEKI